MPLTPLSSASECAEYIYEKFNTGDIQSARIAALATPYFELTAAVAATIELAANAPFCLLNIFCTASMVLLPPQSPASEACKLVINELPNIGKIAALICQIVANLFLIITGPIIGNIHPPALHYIHNPLNSLRTWVNQSDINALALSSSNALCAGGGLEDVVGLEDIKAELKSIINQFRPENKTFALECGVTPPNGILLHGKPGCGKTYIVEKFVEQMIKDLGKPIFFGSYKASDGSTLLHGTAIAVKELFKSAAEATKTNKVPSVIFIDEIDTVLANRKTMLQSHSEQARAEELGTFLDLFNNAGQKNIIVICATNDFNKLDEALIRDGRMDTIFHIKTPSEGSLINQFVQLFEKLTVSIAKEQNLSFEGISQKLVRANKSMSSVHKTVKILQKNLFDAKTANKANAANIILTQAMINSINI